MPKLLVFAACEKVITSHEDSSISIVSLLDTISMPVPPEGAGVPSDANAPIRWAVFTLWSYQPEDEGKQYNQRIRLIKPDGQESMEAYMDFQIPTRKYQTTLNVVGFPVAQAGMYTLQLALTVDEVTQEIAEYSIEVKHLQQGA